MPQPDGTLRTGIPPAAAADAGEGEVTRPPSEDLVRQLDAIQAVMHDDALRLQLEITPTDTPVIGRLLGSMRAAVHSLVVFYGNQLAAKQTEINRVYGNVLQQLLRLSRAPRIVRNSQACVRCCPHTTTATRKPRSHENRSLQPAPGHSRWR